MNGYGENHKPHHSLSSRRAAENAEGENLESMAILASWREKSLCLSQRRKERRESATEDKKRDAKQYLAIVAS